MADTLKFTFVSDTLQDYFKQNPNPAGSTNVRLSVKFQLSSQFQLKFLFDSQQYASLSSPIDSQLYGSFSRSDSAVDSIPYIITTIQLAIDVTFSKDFVSKFLSTSQPLEFSLTILPTTITFSPNIINNNIAVMWTDIQIGSQPTQSLTNSSAQLALFRQATRFYSTYSYLSSSQINVLVTALDGYFLPPSRISLIWSFDPGSLKSDPKLIGLPLGTASSENLDANKKLILEFAIQPGYQPLTSLTIKISVSFTGVLNSMPNISMTDFSPTVSSRNVISVQDISQATLLPQIEVLNSPSPAYYPVTLTVKDISWPTAGTFILRPYIINTILPEEQFFRITGCDVGQGQFHPDAGFTINGQTSVTLTCTIYSTRYINRHSSDVSCQLVILIESNQSAQRLFEQKLPSFSHNQNVIVNNPVRIVPPSPAMPFSVIQLNIPDLCLWVAGDYFEIFLSARIGNVETVFTDFTISPYYPSGTSSIGNKVTLLRSNICPFSQTGGGSNLMLIALQHGQFPTPDDSLMDIKVKFNGQDAVPAPIFGFLPTFDMIGRYPTLSNAIFPAKKSYYSTPDTLKFTFRSNQIIAGDSPPTSLLAATSVSPPINSYVYDQEILFISSSLNTGVVKDFMAVNINAAPVGFTFQFSPPLLKTTVTPLVRPKLLSSSDSPVVTGSLALDNVCISTTSCLITLWGYSNDFSFVFDPHDIYVGLTFLDIAPTFSSPLSKDPLYQSSKVSVADKAFFETGIDLVDTIVFNFGQAQGLIEKHLRPDGTKAAPEMLVVIRSANVLKFPLYNSDIVTPTATDNVQNMYCSWTQVSLPSGGSPYYFNVIPATSPKNFIDSRTEQL
jgi:hypothetical protein